jgi:hypothetical protein
MAKRVRNRVLSVALGVWTALGCAHAGAEARREAGPEQQEKKKERSTLSERVAGRAAGGAVDDALKTLDDPENRERLARIVASPPMQAAIRDITAHAVAGIFDGVDMARDKGQVPRLGGVGKSIGQGIDRDVTPAVGRLVGRTVDAALGAATSDENAARMEELVQRSGAAVAVGLSAAVREQVGPALAVTIERDLLPAVGRGLQSPDVQAAIVKSMASLGVGAARGTQAGLAEADASGVRNGRVSVGGTLAIGVVVAALVAVAFGVLFIVMTVLLVRANRRQRELIEQSRRREERFLAVLEGREDTHREPATAPGIVG